MKSSTALCTGLVAAGVPIDRFALFIYTLHPNRIGWRYTWTPEKGVVRSEGPIGLFSTEQYTANPLPTVIAKQISIRRKLADPSCPHDFIIVDELIADGFTDYLVQPIIYTTGETNAASWSSKADGGFSDEAALVLERINHPLARITEAFLLRANAASVLSAYVGRNGGHQVLNGKIHRGDGEEIEASILFTDIAGFTELSNAMAGPEVVAMLNDAFDLMVPAVERHGGEILKFLGDGFFAIFPHVGEDGLARTVDAARGAVAESEEAVARRRGRRARHLPLGDPCRALPLRQHRRGQPARLHGDRPAGELHRKAARRRLGAEAQARRLRTGGAASRRAGHARRGRGVQGVCGDAAGVHLLRRRPSRRCEPAAGSTPAQHFSMSALQAAVCAIALTDSKTAKMNTLASSRIAKSAHLSERLAEFFRDHLILSTDRTLPPWAINERQHAFRAWLPGLRQAMKACPRRVRRHIDEAKGSTLAYRVRSLLFFVRPERGCAGQTEGCRDHPLAGSDHELAHPWRGPACCVGGCPRDRRKSSLTCRRCIQNRGGGASEPSRTAG